MIKTSVFIKDEIMLEKGHLSPGIELYQKGNDYKIISRQDDGSVISNPVDFYLFHYALEKAKQQKCIEFISSGELDLYTFIGQNEHQEPPGTWITGESVDDAERQLKEWLRIKGKSHLKFNYSPKA